MRFSMKAMMATLALVGFMVTAADASFSNNGNRFNGLGINGSRFNGLDQNGISITPNSDPSLTVVGVYLP